MPETIDKNLNEIVEYCLENNIQFIIPTRDQELLFWSRHKSYLKSNNIHVFVSSKEVLNICLDKIKFYNFCKKNNFHTIESSLNIDEINSDFYVVKERFGSGSNNIGINLNRIDALEFSNRMEVPIFQPYIESKEISVDSWISKNGYIPGVSMRTRSIIVKGESKLTSTFKNKFFEEQINSIISKLSIKGPLVIQAFIDKNKLIFIECNPRIGGASTISIKNGLNIFLWSIIEILDPSYRPKLIENYSVITQLRTENDIYYYDSNF